MEKKAKRNSYKSPKQWVKSITARKPSIEQAENIITGLQEYVDNFKAMQVEAIDNEIAKLQQKKDNLLK